MKYECPELNCRKQYAEYRDFRSHCKSKHNLNITKQSVELYLLDRPNGSPISRSERQTSPEDGQKEHSKISSSPQYRDDIREEERVATCESDTQRRSKRKIRKKVFDDHLATYGKVSYVHCPVQRCGKRCVNYRGLQSHCLIKHGLQLKKDRAQKYLIGNAPQDRQVKNLVRKRRKGNKKYTPGERVSVHAYQGPDVTCNDSNNRTDKCPICGRDKVDEYHLKNHDRMIYTCPKTGCGWMYEAPTNYRSHCYKKHNISISMADESKIRTCSICGRIKVDENHEKEHEKMIHKCSRCGWMYQNWNTLDSHCRSKHGYGIKRTNKSTRTCSICGRKNIDPDHEKDHEKMIHKCQKSGCGWMYENWNTLDSHSRSKHGYGIKRTHKSRSTCSICCRKNVDPDHEKDHVKMIHKCPKSGCGWMYENWETLRVHCSRKHGITPRGDRTYSVCGRKNIDHEHEKDHDEVIHKCPESGCGWMNENWSTLRVHCSRKHGININAANNPVQSAESSGLLSLDVIKRETITNNIDEKCPSEGQIIIGEAKCDYGTGYAERICVKTEPPWEANGEQMAGQNEIDTCVNTNKRNGNHKARKSGENLVDNEGSEDDSNDSEYDPEEEDWDTQGEECSFRETGIIECHLCGRKLTGKTYECHIENHDKKRFKCVCGWMFEERRHTSSLDMINIHIKNENIADYAIPGRLNSETYDCLKCGRRLKGKPYLRYHIQNHHKMQFKCVCGWMFEERHFFHSHALKVHSIHITKCNIEEYTISDQNSGAYSCKKCGRILAEKNYQNHVDSHDSVV